MRSLIQKSPWTIVSATGILAGAIVFGSAKAQDSPRTDTLQPATAKAHANALSIAFREVYRNVAPSVVNIRSIQRVELTGGQAAQPGSPADELFRRFFGGELPDGGEFRFGQPSPAPRERRGEGTGIIVRENGYIVTNNHVVEDATTVRVRLDNETEYEANVVGTDPETDLAVLKIDVSGLTPASFAKSDNAEIGDWVVAIGSPLGLRQTMTAGIISAKGRGNLGLATIGDFIQTDCAINPGNSGGPLVNLDGQIIGINTAISTRTGFYMGVGFAIPSNIVTPVINTIIEGGTVKRGWLGVDIRPLTPKDSEYAGFEGTRGVLISDVLQGSPAEAAGLQPGDIVTQVNGRVVAEPSQLLNTVAAIEPGQQAKLMVFREGKVRDFSVTLGNRSDELAARTGQPEAVPAAQGELGAVVQDMTPEIARQLGAANREGVVVARIAAGSLAAAAGLQAGDVISMVNDTRIANVQEFNDTMREAVRNRVVRLQVFRDGATSFIYIRAQRR